MEAGRRTLPGVPKYLYGMFVPSRASAGRLPRASSAHRARSVHLQPPVFGKHCRWGRPEVPEAGAGGWQQGSGERWPGWVAHPVHSAHLLVLGAGTRPGLPGLWVMALRAQKGCRQPSISSRCQRPTAPICCHLGWEGFVFFSCLSLSFSPPVFSIQLGVRRGLLTPSNFPPKNAGWDCHPGTPPVMKEAWEGNLGYPRYQDCPARGSLRPNPTKGLFAGDVSGGEQAVQVAGWPGHRPGTPDP